MLNQELIIELKDILKDDFGISLTIEETMQFALVFIKYFDLLAKIGSQKEVEIYG